MFPKYRGKQVLMRDENGLEKCVACGLCSVACPADAIYLEAAENDGTVQAGPRYASVYQIHKTRCIFCGYCEEACPVGAIFMGKDYELAVYSKDDFVWDKTGAARAGERRAGARRSAGTRRSARRSRRPPAIQPRYPFTSCPCRLARSATFTARSTPSRSIMARHPTCRSGFRSATSPATTASTSRRCRPLYWIKGNNEDFDVIAGAMAGHPPAPTLHYLPNGGPYQVGPWRVAALGGTFAPSWYHTPAAALPPSRGRRTAGGIAEARQEPRRQAPAFRARRSDGVQGADGHRRVPDARGAAAVLSRRGAASMPARP